MGVGRGVAFGRGRGCRPRQGVRGKAALPDVTEEVALQISAYEGHFGPARPQGIRQGEATHYMAGADAHRGIGAEENPHP
jgi:hypothetical protein